MVARKRDSQSHGLQIRAFRRIKWVQKFNPMVRVVTDHKKCDRNPKGPWNSKR